MPHFAPGFAVILFLPLAVACGDEPTAPDAGEPFTLAPGDAATLEPVRTMVRFLDVTQDSRCPLRAECVWAGDGAVALEITTRGGSPIVIILHTNEAPRATVLDSYELTLLVLDPYPETTGSIAPDDYRVTLVLHERLQ